MDSFTDQHSVDFLNKEWLVRIDNASSNPYLFKFLSFSDGRCAILVTDTANVWFEALDSKQLLRRWRQLNQSPEPSVEQESAWRARTFKKLSSLHTLKAMQECVFSIEDSHDADLAFELKVSDCKWRWECYLLGPKTSAKILSKHLIFPLLSVTHLAFSSADPVCELDLEDLQQAVDKVAKTGRRAHDVHVRQTMSRPRVATTLARMTAMLNFAHPIPLIVSDVSAEQEEEEEAEEAVNVDAIQVSDGHNANPSSSSITQILHEPRRRPILRAHSGSSSPSRGKSEAADADPSPSVAMGSGSASRQKKQTQKQKRNQDTGRIDMGTGGLESPSSSATEPETGDDDEAQPPTTSAGVRALEHHDDDDNNNKQAGPSSRAESARRSIVHAGGTSSSASDSSQPRRASKKAKLNVVPEDSDDDDDAGGNEARRRAAAGDTRPPPPSRPASVGRGAGVRQPMKRGGRRF